jgi:4-amino-4-deoxy-L-arabinose transferase-like glycosyltransferase
MTTSVFETPKRFTIQQQRWLLGLVALAFGLRLYQLGEQSVWFDESISALFAVQPLSTAIRSMLEEGLHQSPLYYLLLRPFALDGFNEFSLRFGSAVVGVLAVPFLAQLGRLVANRWVGVLAALFLVFNPFHVWYSQEMRMYALVMTTATGAMFFFARCLRRSSYQNWLGVALFSTIGLNTHHFALFMPLVQFLFIIITFKQNYALLRPWLGVQLLAGLSFIPWLLVVLDWGNFYVNSSALHPPAWYGLAQTFWNFSIGYTGQLTVFVIVALSLCLCLLILGLISSFRTRYGLLLLLWLMVPPLLTFIMSFRLPMYMDRYISPSFPALVLLLALGVGWLRWPSAQLPATVLVLGALLTGLSRVYFDPSVYYRADWRSLGSHLEKQAASGDTIAPLYYQGIAPLIFYYHGKIPLTPIIIFNQVNLPALPPTQTAGQKLWLIIEHPNDSAHLVGHCQEFDMEALSSPATVKTWRASLQDRLVQVEQFACLRLEVYE